MRFRVVDIQKMSGVSLIEVLVALLVLSIGLLGFAALQGFSLQAGQHSYNRSQAVDLAYEVADYARANRIRTLNTCDLPDQVSYWDDVVAERLPSGTLIFNVTDCANGEAEVTLSWLEGRLDEVEDGVETVNFVTRI